MRGTVPRVEQGRGGGWMREDGGGRAEGRPTQNRLIKK